MESGGFGKIGLGAFIFLVGLALTVAGSSGRINGGHIVFWGAMVAGIGIAFRGLVSLSDRESLLIARGILPAALLVIIAVIAFAVPRFREASSAIEKDSGLNSERKALKASGVRDGFGDGVGLTGTKYDSIEKTSLTACADQCKADTKCEGYTFNYTWGSCAFYSYVQPGLCMPERRLFTCPECHGSLLQLRNENPVRYRCHTGHAYTADSLLAELSEIIESSVWTSIRSIEESVMLMRHMAKHLGAGHHADAAQQFLARADDAQHRADLVRKAVAAQVQLSEAKMERDQASANEG